MKTEVGILVQDWIKRCSSGSTINTPRGMWLQGEAVNGQDPDPLKDYWSSHLSLSRMPHLKRLRVEMPQSERTLRAMLGSCVISGTQVIGPRSVEVIHPFTEVHQRASQLSRTTNRRGGRMVGATGRLTNKPTPDTLPHIHGTEELTWTLPAATNLSHTVLNEVLWSLRSLRRLRLRVQDPRRWRECVLPQVLRTTEPLNLENRLAVLEVDLPGVDGDVPLGPFLESIFPTLVGEESLLTYGTESSLKVIRFHLGESRRGPLGQAHPQLRRCIEDTTRHRVQPGWVGPWCVFHYRGRIFPDHTDDAFRRITTDDGLMTHMRAALDDMFAEQVPRVHWITTKEDDEPPYGSGEFAVVNALHWTLQGHLLRGDTNKVDEFQRNIDAWRTDPRTLWYDYKVNQYGKYTYRGWVTVSFDGTMHVMEPEDAQPTWPERVSREQIHTMRSVSAVLEGIGRAPPRPIWREATDDDKSNIYALKKYQSDIKFEGE